MASEEDFEYQLQQEALASAQQASNGNNPAVYTDQDGVQFEWDAEKRAWFPRINDDFVAMYQASYGNYEDNRPTAEKEIGTSIPSSIETPQPELPKAEELGPDGKKRKIEEPPAWFEEDEAHNTKVYVSNLPLDITEDEFHQVMKKCGLVMKDDKGKLKLKLYKDRDGNNKGDGLCSYIKIESVQLALDVLDGSDVRDHSIKVERAKFELRGEYDPSLKPKKKKQNRKDKEKKKIRMEKLFDWRPEKIEVERNKNEKTVVIKNFFDPEIFAKDPKLILEYRSDVRDECEERCGPVKKAEIFDLHPEGVAMVTFQEFEGADKCLELMNGRYFAGRRLDAEFWDGKTKYKIKETEEEIERRIQKWDEYLEGSDDEEKKSVDAAAVAANSSNIDN